MKFFKRLRRGTLPTILVFFTLSLHPLSAKPKSPPKREVAGTTLSQEQQDKINTALQRQHPKDPYYFERALQGFEQGNEMRLYLTTPSLFEKLNIHPNFTRSYNASTRQYTYKKMFVQFPDQEELKNGKYIPQTDEIEALTTVLTNPQKYDKSRLAFADFVNACAKDKVIEQQILSGKPAQGYLMQIIAFRKLVKELTNDNIFFMKTSVEEGKSFRTLMQNFVVLKIMANFCITNKINPLTLSPEAMTLLAKNASFYAMQNPAYTGKTLHIAARQLLACCVSCNPNTSNDDKIKAISPKTEGYANMLLAIYNCGRYTNATICRNVPMLIDGMSKVVKSKTPNLGPQPKENEN